MSTQSTGLGRDETPSIDRIAGTWAALDRRPITVTIPTARKISGLGNTTIWKLISEKKLATVKVGRRVLVIYESLERLLTPTAN